jgi:uncharacterized protein (TIGR02996 family)
MIPDLNLRLALVSALAAEGVIPKLDLAALKREHPPDPDEDYNDNLAQFLGDTPLPDDVLARVKDVDWTDDHTMFAIWPGFDGESEEFFIDDLSGLERCTGLERLAIYPGGAGAISDLRPLAALSRLQSLYLQAPLVDLAPLAGLAALETITLHQVKAIDLAPLLALPKLESLRIDWAHDGPAPERDHAQKIVDDVAARGVDVQLTLPREHEPLVPRGPDTPRVSNPDLEARIRAEPDDERGYLVYADWLQAAGDPLGELIMLDHERERARGTEKEAEVAELRRVHYFRHQERFVGNVRDGDDRTWRLGFIRSARSRTYRDDLARLLRAPCARFLTELRMDVRDGTKMLDVLTSASPPPPLRLLAIEQSSRDLDVSKVWRAFPDLREVELKGRSASARSSCPRCATSRTTATGSMSRRWHRSSRLAGPGSSRCASAGSAARAPGCCSTRRIASCTSGSSISASATSRTPRGRRWRRWLVADSGYPEDPFELDPDGADRAVERVDVAASLRDPLALPVDQHRHAPEERDERARQGSVRARRRDARQELVQLAERRLVQLPLPEPPEEAGLGRPHTLERANPLVVRHAPA